MALPFSTICLLWKQLSSPDGVREADRIMQQWFEQHFSSLKQEDHALALLSCLLPCKRYDRVYGLGEKQITAIVVRAWGIGSSRQKALEKQQDNGNIDCASAILNALVESGDLRGYKTPLTVREVEATLDRVAATCDFSSADLRERHGTSSRTTASDLLVDMFRSMSAQEVPWAVRLLLKDLRPAVVPETLVLQLVHDSLPHVLRVLNSMSSALAFIHDEEERRGKKLSCQELQISLQPQAGTLVGLPGFEKARSIVHGHRLMRDREVSVERKYDGEYCQVHVWKQGGKKKPEVKLFSKNGRDSTHDRAAIVPTVRQCLGLDTARCTLQVHCILVGELVVWNDNADDIMPFYKIRRYVTREGRRLGCAEDSPPDPNEHLMVVFHDILLWDERKCIDETYSQRRRYLHELVQPIVERAAIGEQIVMDFSASDSERRLASQMTFALAQNWEGLVLKACQDPYVGADDAMARHVKLKKDYIPGLGDSADLAVVGGRCDPLTAASLGLRRGSWTTFFLACRKVEAGDHDQGVTTCFHIVGQVSPPSISAADVRFLNAHGRLSQMPFSIQNEGLRIVTELKGKALPSHLFSQAAVAEVIGAGFDRPADARYSTLRFSRVKIHHDRGLQEVVDFVEYQGMAQTSREALQDDPEGTDQHSWLVRLGYDRSDCESEAATPSRASEVHDSASPLDHNQSIRNGSATGTKRRAGASLTATSTLKRLRRASTGPEVLDDASAQRYADPHPVEIPDSQTDGESSWLQAAPDAQQEDSQSATSLSEGESQSSYRLGTVLLWGAQKESLSAESRAAVAQLIISQQLDVTHDEDRFWSSVLARSDQTQIEGGADRQLHLVLVGPQAEGVPITMASFMLSALRQHCRVLDRCLSCRINFVAWDAVVSVCPPNAELNDSPAMEASNYVTIDHGRCSTTIEASYS
ncbi:hypothetical protein PMZ80_011168 [Knufia obscura]|uniref:ATP-dependent DNA ligase family profile domain-containing protein n=2 Tax=Knufia TaxID=430999 RepID=A0AAN8E7H1_9EURO|nr:hypothetical protein PMZ80_011168 [Knufia obscura]KAK5947834.1 hypothetical protein OHC33_011150 [Knufia fluminis]